MLRLDLAVITAAFPCFDIKIASNQNFGGGCFLYIKHARPKDKQGLLLRRLREQHRGASSFARWQPPIQPVLDALPLLPTACILYGFIVHDFSEKARGLASFFSSEERPTKIVRPGVPENIPAAGGRLNFNCRSSSRSPGIHRVWWASGSPGWDLASGHPRW